MGSVRFNPNGNATSPVPTSVELSDIFRPEAVVVGLRQRTKGGVLGELVHRLVELGSLTEEEGETAVRCLLAREKLGSTALGGNIALPHCRTTLTRKFVGALGLDLRGIPFDAVDGEPVFCVFLLLAPLDGRAQHYEVLGRIAAIGRDKCLRLQLRGCRTAAAVHDYLQELDRR